MPDLVAATLIWSAAAILGALAFLLFNASTQARSIMSVQEVVDGLVEQVAKVKNELVTRLAELQLQVSAGQEVDLSALSAAIQSLDDIVPDEDDDDAVVADPEPVPVEAAE